MKNIIKFYLHQLNLFYLALSFFSRIPVPKSTQYTAELLSQSNRYFSLVGLLLGIMLAVSYTLFNVAFSVEISVLLMMSLSLLFTGAFHEDGLADMADGFGGGFSAEQCLIIMKDSRIGTYGAVTLIIVLALKFTLLVELAPQLTGIILSLILSQSLSRAVAASLIGQLPYVSDENTSKSKPLASRQSVKELILLLVVGCLPLVFYSLAVIMTILVVLIIFQWIFKRWLLKKIAGFTGDCLGAAQQIAEILILLVLVFYSNNQVPLLLSGATP